MIKVNLIPGGKKRGVRGPRLSFKMPSMEGGMGDRWILGSAAVIVLAVGLMGYLYWSTSSAYANLEVEVAAARADSARYADEISQNALLRAREDSILQRATIIQQIDENRYVWPHILDEVARALPDYTWLEEIVQVSLGDELQFRINGRAGNNFAFTQFMENLEASLFISNVDLFSTEQVAEDAGGFNRAVTAFSLEARFEQPSPDLLETVPLFQAPPEGDSSSSAGL